jgi:hypothetical protein
MPQSTMTYVLSYIRKEIPEELLELAFKSRKFNTTIEQRIISEVIEGPVLLDTNLVGGKRREIFMRSNWLVNLKRTDAFNVTGLGVEGCFYLVPPEAREHRNISSVIGIAPFAGSAVSDSGINFGQAGSYGNTANGMLSQMLNTRTMSQYPVLPMATLEGTNIIRFYPEVPTDGVAVAVMLEYDAEFMNMNASAIKAMQKLCLCAVQQYIGRKLRISIDETEVVAGMEIGVIKEMVINYIEKGEQYDDLLIKLKGAMTYDARSLQRLIYNAL